MKDDLRTITIHFSGVGKYLFLPAKARDQVQEGNPLMSQGMGHQSGINIEAWKEVREAELIKSHDHSNYMSVPKMNELSYDKRHH